ncbi:hypothetical protein ACTG9Q_22470 [Actinokineospora sp. 24-640]
MREPLPATMIAELAEHHAGDAQALTDALADGAVAAPRSDTGAGPVTG